MAQRSSGIVLAGAAAGNPATSWIGAMCKHSNRQIVMQIPGAHYTCNGVYACERYFFPQMDNLWPILSSPFWSGGLALLNAASDAFVAAPTTAPSLRGSAIAQALGPMLAVPLWVSIGEQPWVSRMHTYFPEMHLKNQKMHTFFIVDSTVHTSCLPLCILILTVPQLWKKTHTLYTLKVQDQTHTSLG